VERSSKDNDLAALFAEAMAIQPCNQFRLVHEILLSPPLLTLIGPSLHRPMKPVEIGAIAMIAEVWSTEAGNQPRQACAGR
jgi:hypothetical protein